MGIDLSKDRGTPVDRQHFSTRELSADPLSKLDDDAFTRIRAILMLAVEQEAVRFGHLCARTSRALLPELARIRRIDHHQQTILASLKPVDQTVLETALACEQTKVEVTAEIAQHEPDPYLAQVYRFGLLEDLDHVYRFAALLDRVDGEDPNTILQSYTDVAPGRPTALAHRHPFDEIRAHYDKRIAPLATRLHAGLVLALAAHACDYYVHVGPLHPEPVARALYAEIASIEEQHVTQYESLVDATESGLEQWLVHEATEVYAYHSCVLSEPNPRLRALWERFLDYELGQLRHVAALFEQVERRDASEVLCRGALKPLTFTSHRAYLRHVLREEVELTASGLSFIQRQSESPDSPSQRYRAALYGEPAETPSERVACDYVWSPHGERSRSGTPPAPDDPAAHEELSA